MESHVFNIEGCLRPHDRIYIIYNVYGFLSISSRLWRWIKQNALHAWSVCVPAIPFTCPQRASFKWHCLKTCAFSIANGNQLIFVCTGSRDMWVGNSNNQRVPNYNYCDRPLSAVRRRASSVVRNLFYLNIFFSKTTHWIWTILNRNGPWVVPYQNYLNGSDWLYI